MSKICLSVVVALAVSNVFGQLPVATMKDVDGNVLPKELIALIGETAPPEIPFKRPSKPTKKLAAWKQEGAGGLCTDFYHECRQAEKHIGFDDVRLGNLHATIVREYLKDKTWSIADVVMRKNRNEAVRSGSDCYQSLHNIPTGYHLMAIVDVSSTISKGTRRPPSAALSSLELKAWRENPNNATHIPPGNCDNDQLKAKRAYLVRVDTAKLMTYPRDGIWCIDPINSKCI